MNAKRLINDLPFPIRYSIKYLYGFVPPHIRYGKLFWKTYNFLQESQWWSREKLEDYQMEQLSKLLHHAYENVPYYHDVFDERGLKPNDIKTIKDLSKLPYLTKDIIRKNLYNLISRNVPKSKLVSLRTSGSTGTPLLFYQQKKTTDLIELAFIWKMWMSSGYQFNDRCVILRENVPERLANGNKAWWELDPARNHLILSPYHMTEENLYNYVDKIKQFKPKAIQSLPSLLFILSDFMQRHGMTLSPSPKIILCGSETLYAWQRKKAEDVFKCRVFSWYGQNEKVVLAGECEESSEYHIFPQYGITEIIRHNGESLSREGETGEIVGTGFSNYAMPFIRYKTKDIAVCTDRRCGCGRAYRLLKRIEGRMQDFVVSKTGHLIPLTTIPYSFVNNVQQFQFYQERPGEVALRIVRMPTYKEKDSQFIIRTLREKLGDEVDFSIEFVDDIARTEGGKYLYLIQKLRIKPGV